MLIAFVVALIIVIGIKKFSVKTHDGFAVFLVSFIVVCLFSSLFWGAWLPEKEIIQDTEIVSLRSSTTASGRFFLGCGTIEGKICYTYFKSVCVDSYIGCTLNNNQVKIQEEDREGGLLRITNRRFKYWWYNLISCDLEGMGRHKHYEFHIPKGTLQMSFSVQ